MRARTRKAILFAGLAAVVVWIVVDRAPNRDVTTTVSRVSSQPGTGDGASSAPAEPVAAARTLAPALPERASLGEPAGELFGSQSWQPPPPKLAGPPAKPSPPPMPYRFAGRLIQNGQLQVFLSKGDIPIPVKQGEVLDGTYRVESIAESGVTLTYLPLGHKEVIPISGTLAAATVAAPPFGTVPSPGGQQRHPAMNPFASAIAPGVPFSLPPRRHGVVASTAEPKAEIRSARLLWEGPQEVKLGSSFSVVLRVVSDEPVRASPMELRFDPSVLETVAVQPGKFYAAEAARRFSYRINPGGAIVVGASNPSALPAQEMELLVLTFKPVRSSTTAELSIASLTLEGAGGRAIALDRQAAFKTAVVP